MNMAESVFTDDGRKLGQVVTDSETGRACFRPAAGIEAPPQKLWASVDELRAALQVLYGDCRELAR